jgi:hypothetical protein
MTLDNLALVLAWIWIAAVGVGVVWAMCFLIGECMDIYRNRDRVDDPVDLG